MTTEGHAEVKATPKSRHIKRIMRMSGIKIKHSLMEGWLNETWDEAYRHARTEQADMLQALEALLGSCFSEAESRLSLMIGNGPAFSNPNNENAVALHKRCDRIEEAFKLAEAALMKARGQ